MGKGHIVRTYKVPESGARHTHKKKVTSFVWGTLGCFNLLSDVPKVKNSICSPRDPLIWFTWFPK